MKLKQQAVKALQSLMLDKKFDDSGKKVVVEKKLSGTGSIIYCNM